ncbi:MULTISPECIES: Eco57I restriction-modification methylase domain-containing protein [unclassified Akkermansia]|uniref:Eco57I restriction-modification methylase domain-containing protein n=1 Tax=unclassified Akkermansia TaxID=2608915 RepID=UPI000E8D42C0|nr:MULTISPECIES: Eco57I restriction-modification methylase domain-containing protein [unclassified Akkermansia]HBI12401.1 DNA methyltransferase [Akkermansia sp.]HBN17323.1 DNA methyltransferase [Akkermansia sp.]
MIDHICTATAEYIARMPKPKRKKYGQFFTSKETAVFMAGLFSIPQGRNPLRILDPGAGSGILSIALIERLESIAELGTIELVCYENDPNIVNLLRSNLEWACKQAAKDISYRIVTDNYILGQMLDYNGMLGANPAADKFDMVIGNPPYMKIAKDAPEAIAMPDVCYGAPNLYFLFATMSMFNLREAGEMVYIIPRSWTSGAYFKQFRRRFFEEGALEHIHLFVSREKVFEKESVLQETIIIKAKKNTKNPETITITTTQSNADFSNRTVFEAPYSTVVNGNDCYVYLVTNGEEVQTLKKLNRWTDTLPDIGLKMKTGLTVDFRNREALRDSAEDNAVPLFYSQHIQDGKVVFPAGKEHEYIVTKQSGLLQENTNYLFVKRFTAKEEHRRLQCGVYLARKHPEYTKISTQNKINFISGLRELSECVVYGLYVLFNSTLYDSYYRILNGSTQVNSTEVNSMPVPPINTIEAMGKELIRVRDMSEATCDNILRSYI